MDEAEDKTKSGEGNGGGEGGGEGQPDARDEAMKKLSTQVENLTKGIASYRDEAQAATKVAAEAKAALEEAKKEKKPAVELDPKEEAKLKAWAEENGFVTKEALDAERVRIASENSKSVQTTAVAEFLEKHPEYDDDEKWKAVDAEFKLYKTPTSLPEFRNLLERIHKNLGGGSKDSDRAKAEAKAELIKRGRLNLGGGSQGGTEGSANEADIDKLQARYPNLSREQIEQRLAEIKSLYPAKK